MDETNNKAYNLNTYKIHFKELQSKLSGAQSAYFVLTPSKSVLNTEVKPNWPHGGTHVKRQEAVEKSDWFTSKVTEGLTNLCIYMYITHIFHISYVLFFLMAL